MVKNLLFKQFVRSWPIILGSVIFFLIVIMTYSLIQPSEYRSTIQLLIIQSPETEVDAYTASRSAERLGLSLAKIITTSSFREQVFNRNLGIEDNLGTNEDDRRKNWKHKVAAEVIPETAILKISYYDEDSERAQRVTEGIGYILTTQASEYHSGGEKVKIKIIESPLTSKKPVRPNLILNFLGALVLGLIVGAFIVITKKDKATVSSSGTRKVQKAVEHLPWESKSGTNNSKNN